MISNNNLKKYFAFASDKENFNLIKPKSDNNIDIDYDKLNVKNDI
jgi:hypothetical protein